MVLTAGCASSAEANAARTATAPQPEEPDITVAAIPAVDRAGLYIALDEGLFAQAAMARHDSLTPQVTAAIPQTGYPVGPVVEAGIQRVAVAMLKFGLLGPQSAAEVEQQTLARSMTGLAA